MSHNELIENVKVKKLNIIADSRGRLMEILRCDDDIFETFGQVYLTTTSPNVVKAWHCHMQQTDCVVCIAGMIRLGLYDNRSTSPTKGKIAEYFLGVHSPLLVRIPFGVYHGWKCISSEEALIINTTTRPYNNVHPDELRLPAHTSMIPFDWSTVDG